MGIIYPSWFPGFLLAQRQAASGLTPRLPLELLGCHGCARGRLWAGVWDPDPTGRAPEAFSFMVEPWGWTVQVAAREEHPAVPARGLTARSAAMSQGVRGTPALSAPGSPVSKARQSQIVPVFPPLGEKRKLLEETGDGKTATQRGGRFGFGKACAAQGCPAPRSAEGRGES